jgi:hypothetical protein
MLRTSEMVTLDLLQGQFTKDQCRHYFRHDTAVLLRVRIRQFSDFNGSLNDEPTSLFESIGIAIGVEPL